MKTGSVPPDYSLGCNDDERLFPSGPESSHENPEEFVEYPKPWPCMLSLPDSELLPKSQVLK
jgi:hypothetical protein